MADYLQYPQGDYVPKVVERALESYRGYGAVSYTHLTLPTKRIV